MARLAHRKILVAICKKKGYLTDVSQWGGAIEYFYFVNSQFEQIREQIHEIRNFLSPLDIKLQNLDHQINKSRMAFELKTSELEAKVAQHDSKITQHSELIRQIQLFLKMPPNGENRPPTPVHEDKQNPAGRPPAKPAQ